MPFSFQRTQSTKKVIVYFIYFPCAYSSSSSNILSLVFLGVVTLLKDYEVCKEGDVLTPEQARILVSSQTFGLTEGVNHDMLLMHQIWSPFQPGIF